jgi:23S rRNA (cytosine1962-C5)-methyltransferase
MATITLKAGKERSLQRRHPWIYATAIAKLQGNANPGDTVEVRGAKGEWLASAAWSPSSQLRARVWSFDADERIDRSFFERKLAAAIQRRKHLATETSAIRLVFGEADGLPGLVIDQYGGACVAQFLSAGVDFWKATIVDLLPTLTNCSLIYERSDAAVRTREGLSEVTGLLWSQQALGESAFSDPFAASPDAILPSNLPANLPTIAPAIELQTIQENGVNYQVDIVNGHKTGFYIDQRENRALVNTLTQRLVKQGKSVKVLNCFSYTGGFSLAAAKAGAAEVWSVDSSGPALARAARNAQLNDIPSSHFKLEEANVTDLLKAQYEHVVKDGLEAAGFDIVILDPPKFAPSANHVERAARAYKDLNMRGLRLLKPSGYLLTFSCSGAITVDLFQKIVAGAIVDARVDCQLLQRLAAGQDHPMAMTHPEGEYLKGLLLQRA